MTLVVTPESPYESFKEYVPSSLTVTVEDDVGSGGSGGMSSPIVITSVTIPDSGISASFTDTTFTLSGMFTDVFDRSLSFLDKLGKMGEVAKFDDIPIGFNALTTYIAPTEYSNIITATVTFEYHDPMTYDVVVLVNWEAANANLIVKVAEGRF